MASHCRRLLVITHHERRRFPERCDYITSPGFLDGPRGRERAGLRKEFAISVVTDLAVMENDPVTCALRIVKLMPGVSVQNVLAETGFQLQLAPGGVPLRVGVAGGLLAIGALHGTADRPAELFKGAVERMQQEHLTLEETARKVAGQAHAARQRLPGFHHPQHIIDPRTARLLQLADAYGVSGSHVAMARAIEAATEAYWGRRIYLNGPGAVGAICLDMGFDTELIKGVFLLSRTISLVAHTHEEMQREKGWRASSSAPIVQPLDLSLQKPEFYDGPPERSFPAQRKKSS